MWRTRDLEILIHSATSRLRRELSRTAYLLRRGKEVARYPGDVAEIRDLISLNHEMEIPMAEIAKHAGDVDQLSLRQFKKSSQQIRFIDFINVPPEMESFFHSMKAEWIRDRTFESFKHLESALGAYMRFYNRYRLHSGIDYHTPLEYERRVVQ